MRLKAWHGVGLAAFVVAVGAGLALGATASANEFPGPPIDFTTQHGHPVAGHTFIGLAITNVSGFQGKVEPTLVVQCHAELGGKRLPTRKTVFGRVRTGEVQTTLCSWKIPAGAAGKKLRERTVVYIGNGTVGPAPLSWTVAKR